MNFMDIVVVLVLVFGLRSGYKRGFFKEIYDLVALAITIGIAYILKDFGSNIVTKFDFKEFFHLSINQDLYDLILSILEPLLGFTFIFIVVWLIIKVVILVLLEKRILPNNIDYQKYGAVIAGLKTLVYLTILAFVFSFAPLTKYENLYTDSLFLEPLLKLNVPLNYVQKDIMKIYDNAKQLSTIIKNQGGSLTNTQELIDIIKEVKNNPVITDDLIAKVSKTVIHNDKEVNLSNVDIAQFTTNIKQSENYPLLDSLYNEGVITDSLIVKVLEANNISGITEEDVKKIFE